MCCLAFKLDKQKLSILILVSAVVASWNQQFWIWIPNWTPLVSLALWQDKTFKLLFFELVHHLVRVGSSIRCLVIVAAMVGLIQWTLILIVLVLHDTWAQDRSYLSLALTSEVQTSCLVTPIYIVLATNRSREPHISKSALSHPPIAWNSLAAPIWSFKFQSSSSPENSHLDECQDCQRSIELD